MQQSASIKSQRSLPCLSSSFDSNFEAAPAEDALAQELLHELLCSTAFASCELTSGHLLKEQQEAAFDLISLELRRSGSLSSCPSLPAGAALQLPACATSALQACH